MSLRLKRALAWASAGWPVFPARDNKKPYFADWETAATTDRDTINGWWATVPDAQVATVPAIAGCFVVDVDTGKEGRDGYASLGKLETDYSFSAANFPSQKTPSGGCHFFMRGQFPTSHDTLGQGIDTRGGMEDGTSRGYVLCYVDTPPCATVDVPLGVSFQFTRRNREAAQTEAIIPLDEDRNIKRAEAYLKEVVAVPEGSRGITLFKHACVMRDLGVSERECVSLMAEYPAALGEPAQDEDEALGRIASAYRNAQLPAGNAGVNPQAIALLVAEHGTAANDPGPSETRTTASARARLATWPQLRDRPEPAWVIDGLIPGNSVVGLFGPGGSYKSFIALDMAMAISQGWLEWGGMDVKTHGPVVMVSGEGSQGPRVRAWETHNNAVGETFAVLDGINLSDPEDVRECCEAIQAMADTVWHKPPVAIIVDTLARAAGGADENSNKDMSKVVEHLDAIRRSFNCAVIVVHHTPKRDDEEWRGASATWFALDAGLLVRKSETNKATIKVKRMKDAQDGARWAIGLTVVATGRGEEDSLVVTSARPWKDDNEKHERKVTERQEAKAALIAVNRANVAKAIIEGLPTGKTISRSELAKFMTAQGVDPNAARTWLTMAAKPDGELHAYAIDAGAGLEFTAPA